MYYSVICIISVFEGHNIYNNTNNTYFIYTIYIMVFFSFREKKEKYIVSLCQMKIIHFFVLFQY